MGITRSKNRLFLTRAAERKKFGESIPSIPSRFLEEIDSEFIMTEEKILEQSGFNFLDELEALKLS